MGPSLEAGVASYNSVVVESLLKVGVGEISEHDRELMVLELKKTRSLY